jgi:hypothetical protein
MANKVLVRELPTAAEIAAAFRAMTRERLDLRQYGIEVDDDGRILPVKAEVEVHT